MSEPPAEVTETEIAQPIVQPAVEVQPPPVGVDGKLPSNPEPGAKLQPQIARVQPVPLSELNQPELVEPEPAAPENEPPDTL